MYWITRGGFVVEQRGQVVHSKALMSGAVTDKINAYNVPTGGFRGLLRLDGLRPATAHEVERAKGRT